MALSGHRSRVHGVNKAGEAVIKKLYVYHYLINYYLFKTSVLFTTLFV